MNPCESASNRYTKESAIITYTETTFNFNRKTISKRLQLFKEYIYYCSYNQNNPMFHELTIRKTGLSTELINIYELIYKYFETTNSLSFEINSNTNPDNSMMVPAIDSFFILPNFKWNVSEADMPLLGLYICNTSTTKKKISVSDFFKSLTDMQSILCDDLNSQISIFLNKSYFLSLEEIYHKFAKTLEQQQLIRESISPITRLCINAYNTNDLPRLVFYSKSILSNFKEQLASYSDTLYNYEQSQQPRRELDLLYFYLDKLNRLSKNLLTSICENLKTHPFHKDYPLSVDNYSDFFNANTQTLNTIKNLPEEFEDSISTFFINLKRDSDIITAQENNLLTYDFQFEEEHIDKFYSLFKKYASKIVKDFSDFFKKMEKASHQTKYIDTIPQPDDYSNLDKWINRALSKLHEELNDTLNNLPKLFIFHRAGCISQIGYNQYPLPPEKILKILKLLFPDCDFQTETLNNDLNALSKSPFYLGSFLLFFDKSTE